MGGRVLLVHKIMAVADALESEIHRVPAVAATAASAAASLALPGIYPLDRVDPCFFLFPFHHGTRYSGSTLLCLNRLLPRSHLPYAA